MNAWDYALLAYMALTAVLAICLIGTPRTGKFSAATALAQIALLALVWMAVSS